VGSKAGSPHKPFPIGANDAPKRGGYDQTDDHLDFVGHRCGSLSEKSLQTMSSLETRKDVVEAAAEC
jgi:hypothetical protein